MTVSSGLLDIEKLLCRGEYTYERGEPLEISALVKVGRTGSGEASVQLEVFRKKFCSYERIYSKKVRNIIKDSHESCTYTICIPGYETEEFNQEQQLKMRVRIALNGDSISKEVLWKVLEG